MKDIHKFGSNTFQTGLLEARSNRPTNSTNLTKKQNRFKSLLNSKLLPDENNIRDAKNNICVAARTAGFKSLSVNNPSIIGSTKAMAAAAGVATTAEFVNYLGRTAGRVVGEALVNEVCHVGKRRATVRKVLSHVIIVQEAIERLNGLAEHVEGEYSHAVVVHVISKIASLFVAPVKGFIKGAKNQINVLNARAEEMLEELRRKDEENHISIDDDYLKVEIRMAITGDSIENRLNDPTQIIIEQEKEVEKAEEVMALQVEEVEAKITGNNNLALSALRKERRERKKGKRFITDGQMTNILEKLVKKKGGAQNSTNLVDSIIDDYFFTVDINGKTYLAEPSEIPVINEILNKDKPENNRLSGGRRKTYKANR